ncbi:MAG: BLUF domain-containing protein [Kordiimonadaceae bacterium]|nr:BLUF domain-containing protein [Kordiimonadaceae bacterium]
MYHLVYISDRNQGDAQDMEHFVNLASNFNEEHNVTGALWFNDLEFVHLMEGDTTDLEVVYNFVTDSITHDSVKLVCIKKCGRRFFGDWTMASFGEKTHSGQIAQQFGTSSCFQPRKLPADRLINLLYFLEEERKKSADNAIC